MNAKTVLRQLKALGTEQTRKTYARHGVTGEMFGVKYGDLEKLRKQIKTDQALALGLWESGNHDARVLASKIADPAAMSAKQLTSWMKGVDNHVLAFAVAQVAAKSPAGRKQIRKWMNAKSEWPAAAGWSAFAEVVAEPGAVSADECRELLAEIEARIHSSKNRVRYSMNNALISIGAYAPGLEDEAVEVAERIGPVDVDHGDTSCETPDAAAYIRKAAAHHRKKLSKQAAKKQPAKKQPAKKRAAKKKPAKKASSARA